MLGLNTQLSAQRSCIAVEYRQKAILNTPSLIEKIAAVENFTTQQLKNNATFVIYHEIHFEFEIHLLADIFFSEGSLGSEISRDY